MIDMTPNQNGDGAGDGGVGRDDVGHRDRHFGVELHRLEAPGNDHEVAGNHAMQPHRRFVDGAFDAELGENHEQARRDAGQGKAACWCAGA